MKTISIAVSEEDYEKFREVAESNGTSIAKLIREAMAAYRATTLERPRRLERLAALAGHSAKRPLPLRHEIYDEVYGEQES